MTELDIDRMTLEQTRAAAQQLLDSTTGDLEGAGAERFQALTQRAAQLREQERQRVTASRDMVQRLATGELRTEGEGRSLPGYGRSGDYDRDPIGDPRSAEDHRYRGRDPWDLRELRTFGRDPRETASELRARALSAVEHMPGASDGVRESATNILERHDSTDSKIARHALITSSPAYLRAWAKMARDERYALTDDEVRALQEAEQFRAMSLTDSAGGFLVPLQVDPAVIVTSSGVYSEIRAVARQVVATGDAWNGVSSAAISWSWDAEATEVSDDSPSFAQPAIPIYKAQGFVPISVEALQDAANVTEEVGKLFAEGQADLEGTALITGSGSGQPTGIVTALAASSPTVVVNAAADDTFALSDVYSLHGALPARWRRNASWLANNLIYHKIRQFDTAGGGGYWTNVGGDRPERLLGRQVVEAEAMDGTITTSGSVHNYALIFGDFSSYVVATRLGMTVELIPHLFGASRRPTGQRGWIAWYRIGADSVNDNAFRMLDVVSVS
jgi:HK97 family phage major capsid protein